MRTMIRLDDDVLLAVRERARRERRSAGDVLSDLARQALRDEGRPRSDEPALHGFRALPQRGTAISDELIDRLRDEEGHVSRALLDVNLLALAVAHAGRFVTFDRGITLAAVPGAAAEHLVLL